MASSSLYLPFIILLALLNSSSPAISCYTSIFSFGDSITDTGNLLSTGQPPTLFYYFNLPYGETFFHHPTGRFCNGRLILDFIAEAMGMPLVPAYLGRGPEGDGYAFRRGANFAVGGATALTDIWSNFSLGVEMQWFKQLLPSLCSSASDCSDKLSKSLFLVGEIGGNDYNYRFLQAKLPLDEIRATVPKVIGTISLAINDLIGLGARRLVVPGNFPMGCFARYLTVFQSSREEDYDPNTGCIKWLTEFAEHHNSQLQQELDRIRTRHPYATIIYADYYNAALSLFRSHSFEVPLSACCGGGGPYNYNRSAVCGTTNARACDDPSTHLNWDGLHLTEVANGIIARGLLDGPFSIPRINYKCPQIDSI